MSELDPPSRFFKSDYCQQDSLAITPLLIESMDRDQMTTNSPPKSIQEMQERNLFIAEV